MSWEEKPLLSVPYTHPVGSGVEVRLFQIGVVVLERFNTDARLLLLLSAAHNNHGQDDDAGDQCGTEDRQRDNEHQLATYG